jgi:integrase
MHQGWHRRLTGCVYVPGHSRRTYGPGNYRRRVLHKIAKQLGLPKLTFQVIRRTIATLSKNKGHVKDIQGLMRHTKASTTTDVYMQSLEHEVRTTINSIHDELADNGSSGGKPEK